LKKPFYGWVIVGVCFLIGVTEVGVFQNILSIFMKPMVGDFGWSRAAVTGAIAVGSISGGLVSPLIGPILDRYGPRMVAFFGILFFSIGLSALMFIRHIWQLYLFFGTGRMIAVGMLSLVISVSVSNWFVSQRGRALGITWIGERVGSALLPLMIQFLILAYGWRTTWGVLGVVVFLLSGIPSILFLRRRPEDMGLLPDNAPPAGAISLQWFTRVKYLNNIPLSYLAGAIVVKKSIFKKIPQASQEVIMDCFKDYTVKIKQVVRKQNQDAVRVMEKHGIIIRKPPRQEVEKFKTLSKKAMKRIEGKHLAHQVLAEVNGYLEQYRKEKQ